MLGIPKEVVFKDLDEVLAKAMNETGDFDVSKYRFVFRPSLYYTIEVWMISENLLNINRKFKDFRGVKIEIMKHTQYFYLEYSKIPFAVKTFAPTETIKKYIQVDDDD